MSHGGVVLFPYLDGAPPNRRLTRRSRTQPASIFVPQDPTLTPEEHFPLQTVSAPGRAAFPRFINRFDSREILLVVDGSCVNNGRHADKLQDPSGGCAFIFKGVPSSGRASARGSNSTSDPRHDGGDSNDVAPDPVSFPLIAAPAGDGIGTSAGASNDVGDRAHLVSGSVAFRLEAEGPSGARAEHTSNRAKLRAVIAALQFRQWGDEGWRRAVVLTDLEYIVWGATRWLPRWVAWRWRKPFWVRRTGGPRYSNRDLWEELQHRVEELRAAGCEVSFWLVRGEHGSSVIAQAKAAAQRAARAFPEQQVDKFTKLCGIMV